MRMLSDECHGIRPSYRDLCRHTASLTQKGWNRGQSGVKLWVCQELNTLWASNAIWYGIVEQTFVQECCLMAPSNEFIWTDTDLLSVRHIFRTTFSEIQRSVCYNSLPVFVFQTSGEQRRSIWFFPVEQRLLEHSPSQQYSQLPSFTAHHL